jgi:DNA polymerase II large subunit
MESYFRVLQHGLDEAIAIAKTARACGLDAKMQPEILPARDLADRVESLVGIAGLSERIRELEKTSESREKVAILIGKDFADGRFGKYEKKAKLVEDAVRSALAILTEGVVAAPIDGIAGVLEGRNDNGTRYARVLYAGPIRSAGGTEQALSVLVADYVRRAVGFDRYIPREEEIRRYIEEIPLYRQVANLQYMPSEGDIRFIVQHCPICIDGEPTEKEDVERYRDLERVDTNRIRGGMALVLAEGVAQKARKLRSLVSDLGLDGWEWLNEIAVDIKKDDDASKRIFPSDKYLRDLVAGRPVFSHPSSVGGFRLRYGRARNSGLAAAGINPATMVLLDEFIAPGTQLKIERPGKGACIVPVDSIDGPHVRLKNGDFLKVDSIEIAYELRDSVEKVIDVGEILISYGEFLENNHPLIPGSYCEEWWLQEVMRADKNFEVPKSINSEAAIGISEKLGVPLHPDYTYLWHDVSLQEFETLSGYIADKGGIENGTLTIPIDGNIKNILETLLVEHKIGSGGILIPDAFALLRCIGLDTEMKRLGLGPTQSAGNALEAASLSSGFLIRKKAPTRIGARMGRPEKSKPRMMKPAPHVLFPLGDAGGRGRLISTALKKGEIEVDIGTRYCGKCKRETFENVCSCGTRTESIRHCPKCGISFFEETCPRCGKAGTSVKKHRINLEKMYRAALKTLGEKENEKLKGTQGLISKDKVYEPLEKGILRAKHGVFVYKDGTIRYDLTNLPLTHFKPKEIGTTVDELRKLGYEKDMYGHQIENDEQLIELKPQDIILSEDAGEYLFKVSKFIDELLVKYYGLSTYYNTADRKDLVGKLVIGLAPHTSAGVLARIIGFTGLSACLAHPFVHAAKRRNADGDEDSVMLLLDALLNFSRSYLPAKRGGSMDAPLVLTMRIDPEEIDSEAHNIDTSDCYPIEFYEATQKYVKPKEIADIMPSVADRLGTPEQYYGLRFTHNVSDIASGPASTAYTRLEAMVDKLDAELNLAKKVRAVDAKDVAERVINSHFIRDLMGNLRAFSTQEVRCSKCSASYRRPPLRGACTKCGSNLILTVSEGSVRKYLEVSIKIAKEYDISDYTKQRLQLLSAQIDSLFSSKREQMGLGDFM